MAFWSRLRGQPFDSADYWRTRYQKGKNSGAGSYGRLAEYKSSVINALVREEMIDSVIEFGSGDGNQASLFDFPFYTGVDVVPQVVQAANARFSDRPGWRFQTTEDYLRSPTRHDMAMSLDVIYHLVEDDVYDAYMRSLTSAASRFILFYSSDKNDPQHVKHVRHRVYSDWMAAYAPAFAEARTWEHPFPSADGSDPAETSFAFFRLYAQSELPI